MLVAVDARATRRVLRLPGPSVAPPGGLEQMACVLLARAARFDPVGQAHLAGLWGLPVPAVLVRRAEQAPGSGPLRAIGVLRRLRALTADCPPPPALLRGLDLVGQVPPLTRDAVRGVLLQAGLSDGDAGARVLRDLAGLWGLPVAGTAVWDGERREQLAALAGQVRRAGAVPVTEPSAGERDWLADIAGVHWSAGHLVAGYRVGGRDGKSAFGIAVRRQVAALGPTLAAVLAVGVVRARPDLASTTPAGVLAWARAQPDLAVQGQLVAASGDVAGWLPPADRAVLALPGEVLERPRILGALVGQGVTAGGADVWLVRCSWLRPAGTRGRYRQAG